MSKSLFGRGALQAYYDSSATGSPRFATIAGAGALHTGNTEAHMQARIGKAGTMADFVFYVSLNGHASSRYFRTRINGTAGTLSVTIGAGATGWFQDTTHSDAVVVGDSLNYEFGANPDFLVQMTLGLACTSFDVSGGCASLHQVVNNASLNSANAGNASTTYYIGITGGATSGTNIYTLTEADAQNTLRASGIMSRATCYVASNTSTNAIAVTSRLNGSDGTMTFSIGASTTGRFEDTTHSDTVASGDLYNYKSVSGAGTVNATVINLATTFDSAGTNWDFRSGSPAGNTIASTSAVTYKAIAPAFTLFTTTEALEQSKIPIACYAMNMLYRITGGSGNSGKTIKTRINGVNGTQIITLNGGNGVFEDTTHYDTIAANDLVNYRADQMASPLSGTYFGLTLDTTPPAAGGRARRVPAFME